MSLRHIILAGAAAAAFASTPLAAKHPTVGGAAMRPTSTIVENASKANNLTTLVAAVKAADLVGTLSSPGPFTVFAPTNAAFDRLPAGTVETLVKPESKAALTNILTYHVVPGRITAGQIASLAARNRGTATLKTVQGDTLRFRKRGSAWTVVDSKGGSSRITIANVFQSNGVVHVIDRVLMP